jgi:pimeloyl-ACP methyl ester carboxylesterase
MAWLIRFVALSALTALAAYSQDIAGDWQGTLKAGTQSLRLILHLAKEDNGDWKAMIQSIDQGGFDNNIPVSFVTLRGSILNLKVEAVRGAYEAKVSPDGSSIKGTWTQGAPLPLEFQRANKETVWSDPSPHTVHFVNAETNVKIEVLDWGGSGRPLVLVPGLGNTAHVFDTFALKLTPAYHVYGITRRGFGASSAPTPVGRETYAADRLGDDVLAVLDSLKLNRPVLVGHSLGGEELSSVGSRHPERIAGLIYLDAGYYYAYYDRERGDFNIDLVDLRNKLEQFDPLGGPGDKRQLIQELLATSLPGFEKDLRETLKTLPDSPPPQQPGPPPPPVLQAITAGMQKYTDIRVPVLAIYAMPHDTGQAFKNDAERTAADARDEATFGTQAKAFETGVPSAHVVRLAHANHYVFRSNEADVLREMDAFLGTLP